MGIREVLTEKNWREKMARFSVHVPDSTGNVAQMAIVDGRKVQRDPAMIRVDLTIRGGSFQEVPPKWFSVLRPIVRQIQILVAADDRGRIVGEARFAMVTEEARPFTMYILFLHVIPELRSAGIGSRLMETVQRIGVERGCNLVVLDVDRENVRARNLFERRGYKRRGNGELDPVTVVFSGPAEQMETMPRPTRRSKVMMFRYLDRDRDAGKSVWMPSNA